MENAKYTAWSCKVRAVGLTDPPQDCDWPFCGCDPYAAKVLEAVSESGYVAREQLVKELAAALEESKSQIEYLHDKFSATGSGMQVIAKIDAALAKVKD